MNLVKKMKYLHMHCENWYLFKISPAAFCLIWCKCTFLIRYFDSIAVFSDMKFWEQLFSHKNANDCFLLCQEASVCFKITESTSSENWFQDIPWLIQKIADFITLVKWLWISITRTNLKKWPHKSSSLVHKSGLKMGYYRISIGISRMPNWTSKKYQFHGAAGSGKAIKHLQLHPRAKLQGGLCYFDTFETCNSWFSLQLQLLFLYSANNVKWISANKEHVNSEFCKSMEDFHTW